MIWFLSSVKSLLFTNLRKINLGLSVVFLASGPLLFLDLQVTNAARDDRLHYASVLNTEVSPLPVLSVEEYEFPPPRFVKIITVGDNDTVSAILRREGMDPREIQKAIVALAKHFNPRQLKVGQEIQLELVPQTSKPNDNIIDSIILRPTLFTNLKLSRQPGRGFKISKTRVAVRKKLFRAAGVIASNLYVAATNANVPPSILMNFTNIYSWDVDFQRGIRKGDRFELLFEALYTSDNKFIRYDNILYGNLILSQRPNKFYLFSTKTGLIDFFDKNGKSARKPLMKTPINGARISSGYGRRRHPILGYTRVHRGIDFAAPTGTPIYAAGNGLITRRSRNGAYGKYIRIRHNSTFDTAYAHLSRYHPKIRVGTRVRQGQVIAYVGSTGRSTGPHLHYEILKNGRQTNPKTLKMPSGVTLKGNELRDFQLVKNKSSSLYVSALPAIKAAKTK